MAERLVRDLAIEEDLAIEIKDTLAKKINFVCGGVLYQMNKGIEKS